MIEFVIDVVGFATGAFLLHWFLKGIIVDAIREALDRKPPEEF